MAKQFYAQAFERKNYYFPSVNSEQVVVIVETKYNPDSDDDLEKYERDAWAALFKQYPVWNCPFHQGKPPKTRFESLRHGWASPSIREHRLIGDDEGK